ncbi:LysM peptidoglycan-binding domain-containing protein [Domibacillus tundrae]|uniref:LysM peptidoglycan-binding domain-containing protein n=1 Tax=Domibacillus tundrae TaxID=1587527 RepID=UPI000617E59E|nr:LysM peptidoglycan-binding domain-containing protein [Domibacillus tundrae]
MGKKSIYEFWLSQGDEKIRLPILPSSIDISSPSHNETVYIPKFGDVTSLQKAGAKTFTFSSYFPRIATTSLAEMRPTLISKPWNYIEAIERWRESGLPCRFIVTRTPINYAVSIESFDHNEEGGAIGDLNYSLSLQEYTFIKAKKIDTKKKSKPTSTTGKRPDEKAATKPKTYKVKSGDALWSIAKALYKDSNQWTKIWNANKAMLIKRDARNIRQPGQWIYAGQVLTIP